MRKIYNLSELHSTEQRKINKAEDTCYQFRDNLNRRGDFISKMERCNNFISNLEIKPSIFSKIGFCYDNVVNYVKVNGGSIQYCYLLWESKKHIVAEHHSIWLSPEGEYVDITPQDTNTLALDWDGKVSIILTDIEYNGYKAPPIYIQIK